MQVNTYVMSAVAGFIVLDVLTGFLKAWKANAIHSSTMREGLIHKISYIVLISIGFIGDIVQAHTDLGFNIPTATAICLYVCASEIVSIAENLVDMNPDLGNWPILKQLANSKPKE